MVKTRTSVLRVLSAVFLAGYLLNLLPFEAFHQAVHHHHAELHTAEAEADACHRAIYHGDVSRDCEHASHFASINHDCELCKVISSRSHEFAGNGVAETAHFSVCIHDFQFGSDIALEPSLLQSFLRGPPTA